MGQQFSYEKTSKAINGGVDVTAVSTPVLAAGARAELALFNASDVNVWIALGAPAEPGIGLRLAPGGSLVDVTWGGSVSAITEGGTVAKRLTFIEKAEA